MKFMGNESVLYFPGQRDGIIPCSVSYQSPLWLHHLHGVLGKRVRRKRMENGSTKGLQGLRFGGESTNEEAFKRLNDCL